MKGIPRNSVHPILMFHPIDRDVKNEDGKYVFVGKTYDAKIVNNANIQKVQDVLSKFPRFNDEELRKANDGVYTWLLYSTGNSNMIRFVATEVVSPFEIGTRHQALAYNARIGASTIYGGGELIKKDGEITFNLLSGTYSKPILAHNFEKTLKNELIQAFRIYFPEAEYDNSLSSYIYEVRTVSNAILRVYKDIGYTVRLFDSRKDYVTFANAFWNYDFAIEHATKTMDLEKNATQKKVWIDVLIKNLKGLIDLLEKHTNTVHGGKRKTRKSKRKEPIDI